MYRKILVYNIIRLYTITLNPLRAAAARALPGAAHLRLRRGGGQRGERVVRAEEGAGGGLEPDGRTWVLQHRSPLLKGYLRIGLLQR